MIPPPAVGAPDPLVYRRHEGIQVVIDDVVRLKTSRAHFPSKAKSRSGLDAGNYSTVTFTSRNAKQRLDIPEAAEERPVQSPLEQPVGAERIQHREYHLAAGPDDAAYLAQGNRPVGVFEQASGKHSVEGTACHRQLLRPPDDRSHVNSAVRGDGLGQHALRPVTCRETKVAWPFGRDAANQQSGPAANVEKVATAARIQRFQDGMQPGMKIARRWSRSVIQVCVCRRTGSAAELAKHRGGPGVFLLTAISTYVFVTFPRGISGGHELCVLLRVAHRSRSLPRAFDGACYTRSSRSPEIIDANLPTH